MSRKDDTISRTLIGIIVVLTMLLINMYATAQCANDFCEDAVEIGCDPYEFDNYTCTGQELCIQPNQGSTNCVLYIQENSQWFTFTVDAEGYYLFNLSTNFTSTDVPAYNYCYGTDYLEGNHWALATGGCQDLDWLSTWINTANCNRCRCFNGNSVTWVDDCSETAPCPNPIPMQPFWGGNCPLVIEPPLPYVYDVCVQDWEVLFYLPQGTYYFIVYGFMDSVGDGVISICPETPLCPKPVAELEGVILTWTPSGSAGYTVYYVSDVQSWNPIPIYTGYETETTISEQGYYYVWSECGGSNLVYANIQPISGGTFTNILGQQGLTRESNYTIFGK